MVENHRVLIARSVSAIQSGQIVVEVLNPLPFPAILQAEEAIGCFYSGTQVDVVNLDQVETGSGVTQETHSLEDVAKAIKAMVTQIDEISCADREKVKKLCEFSDVISVGEKDLG